MKTKKNNNEDLRSNKAEKPLPEAAVLTEREAAAYLSCSTQLLRTWRHWRNKTGYQTGPPFVRLGGGRAIRYRQVDLDEFLLAYLCNQQQKPLFGDRDE